MTRAVALLTLATMALAAMALIPDDYIGPVALAVCAAWVAAGHWRKRR
jgi:hypothetical protein